MKLWCDTLFEMLYTMSFIKGQFRYWYGGSRQSRGDRKSKVQLLGILTGCKLLSLLVSVPSSIKQED